MRSLIHKVVVFLIHFFLVFQVSAQTVELSGYVYDDETNIALPGCSIFIHSIGRGSSTDIKGHYAIEAPPGRYVVVFSYLGYRTDTLEVNLVSSQSFSQKLKPESTKLNQVEVISDGNDVKLTQTETGLITLQRKEIENLPYLLGELDPIRILQLMPGVQTSGEGSTGFYVRGGAIDQNLMQLDKSTVYNPSHLFGFFSIFNGTIVQGLEMYKSGIPANYGGRLSSITRVSTRRGDNQNYKGEGTIGLIAANVMAEGPIKKGNSSFLVSGRRTYVDLFARGLHELNLMKRDIDYYFYDLNLNFDFKLSPRDNLSIRSYYGSDDFSYAKSDFSNVIAWKNKTASIAWQHSYNDLFAELSVQASGYDMGFGAKINTYTFDINSDINDVGLTYQFGLRKGRHDFAWGANYTLHKLRPNNISAESSEVSLSFGQPLQLKSDEASFFLNDKILISDEAELSVGVRFSGYRHLGSFTRYVEDESFVVLDTISYAGNKTIKHYLNLEPRVAFRYSLNNASALKVSYDKTVQYMHMAPLSSVSLPLDIWVPSSSVIKPQIAHQISAGYYRNFKENEIETSVVLYYKSMQNQLEYREGVVIGYSKGFNFDDNFVFGRGVSFGSEFQIKKTKGRLNGQLSYTLSRTTRTFKELNEGKSFAAKYDRLHDLSIMANFQYSRKWIFSSVFVYGTGNALNLPVARYIIQENVINEYGARNSFRMPAYHRLDLAVTYTAHKSARWEAYWVFSIYNVYSRKNPYYIYFETKGDLNKQELKTSIKQVSLFPIIPAVTYRIKF